MKYWTFLLFCLSSTVYGQTILSGQLIDGNKQPIEQALIEVIGRPINTTTMDAGTYLLKLPKGIKNGDVLQIRISKEGYKTSTKLVTVSQVAIPLSLTKNKNYKPKLLTQSNANSKTVEPVNVTSNFQSGGITANKVYLGPQQRTLNLQITNQLLSLLPDKMKEFLLLL